MKIENGPQLDQLVIDFEVTSVWEPYEDADYYLYRQNVDLWEPVGKVKKGLLKGRKGQRGRGLIKDTSFELVFEQGDLIASDKVTVIGAAHVEYSVLNPDSLLNSSVNLTSRLIGFFKAAFSNAIKEHVGAEIQTHNEEIEKSANKTLERLQTLYGVRIKVFGLDLRTELDRVAGQIIETQARNILDQIVTLHQIDMKRLVAESEIQLDAQRILAIGDAENTVEIDRMRRKAETLLGMGLNPQELPAVISLVDPNAAIALAEVLRVQTDAMLAASEIQLEQQKVQLLERYLETKQSSPAAPPGQISPPMSSPQQLPARSSDPVETAIRRAFPDVMGVQWSQDGRKKKYSVEFEDLTISFFTGANEISRVYFGTSSPSTPLSRLGTTIPKGNDVEALALQLIKSVRNDYAKWQARH